MLLQSSPSSFNHSLYDVRNADSFSSPANSHCCSCDLYVVVHSELLPSFLVRCSFSALTLDHSRNPFFLQGSDHVRCAKKGLRGEEEGDGGRDAVLLWSISLGFPIAPHEFRTIATRRNLFSPAQKKETISIVVGVEFEGGQEIQAGSLSQGDLLRFQSCFSQWPHSDGHCRIRSFP